MQVNNGANHKQMKMIDEYDTAILISGDGDFSPAIMKAKSYPKKRIQVAFFENEIRKCYSLKEAANSFINLSHIIPSILNNKKP